MIINVIIFNKFFFNIKIIYKIIVSYHKNTIKQKISYIIDFVVTHVPLKSRISRRQLVDFLTKPLMITSNAFTEMLLEDKLRSIKVEDHF